MNPVVWDYKGCSFRSSLSLRQLPGSVDSEAPSDQVGESLGTLKPGWTAGVCTLEYTVLLLLMIGMYMLSAMGVIESHSSSIAMATLYSM